MSEAVYVALIGLVGVLIGAAATVLTAIIQAAYKARHAGSAEPAETAPVLGHAVEIRELRILRALFGEPKGRILEGYKDSYYRRSLEEVIRKGWAKRIDKRYWMTPKGAAFCQAYLRELFATWQPEAQVLA